MESSGGRTPRVCASLLKTVCCEVFFLVALNSMDPLEPDNLLVPPDLVAPGVKELLTMFGVFGCA